jgi:hypothetical protein
MRAKRRARIPTWISASLFGCRAPRHRSDSGNRRNLEYYLGDKGSVEAIDRFNRQPEQFSARLQGALTLQMATPSELKSATHQMYNLWKEVVGLTEGRYVAKYDLAR